MILFPPAKVLKVCLFIIFMNVLKIFLSFSKGRDLKNDRIDEGTKYFPDFPDSLINLIVLLTTANNPDGKKLF